MSISAKEGAKATGLSKQAVINSINSGQISAGKEVDGAWQIEPFELFRHHQPVSSLNGNGHQDVDDTLQPLDSTAVDTLQVEVRVLREQLAPREFPRE